MEKSWFTERIGQKVRMYFDYLGQVVEKERVIGEDDTHYMWLLSEKGYRFEEVKDDWLAGANQVTRIARPLNVCIACEG